MFRLGKQITASADHSMQLMMTAAARPGDVIIGSSFSGRNHELARHTGDRPQGRAFNGGADPEQQRRRRCRRLRHRHRPAGGRKYLRPTSTRFAYLAVIDILANLVAYRTREHAATTLRNIKTQLVLHRDKDDSQLLGD